MADSEQSLRDKYLEIRSALQEQDAKAVIALGEYLASPEAAAFEGKIEELAGSSAPGGSLDRNLGLLTDAIRRCREMAASAQLIPPYPVPLPAAVPGSTQ